MDKVLKVLVVLVLIVSAVALAFELKLFKQRGELKGRNQILSRYVTQIAKTIEVPGDANPELTASDRPHMQVTDEQLKAFYQHDAKGSIVKDASGKPLTTGSNTMDAVLKDIVTSADLQFSRLNDTRSGLLQTRTTLTETKDALTKTEGELTQAKETVKQATEERDAAKQDVEKKKAEVEELTAKNETCEAKVDKQASEVSKLTDKLADRQSQLDATKRYVEKLEGEIAAAQAGGATNALPPGIRGQIVFVNTNWNFVVVDLMPQARVFSATDLTVQRDDKLVGKVRVSAVFPDRNFAVGEILPDWAQSVPAKGDYVFY